MKRSPASKKRPGATPGDNNCGPGAPASGAPPALSPAGAPAALLPVPRTAAGQFPVGVSGNPNGKPKGLRNFITRERLALESVLRSYLNDEVRQEKVKKALDRLFTIAETGEDKEAINAIKIVLDKVMVSPRQEEEGNEGNKQVTIIIDSRLPSDRQGPPQRVEVIDHDEIE